MLLFITAYHPVKSQYLTNTLRKLAQHIEFPRLYIKRPPSLDRLRRSIFSSSRKDLNH